MRRRVQVLRLIEFGWCTAGGVEHGSGFKGAVECRLPLTGVSECRSVWQVA